MAQAPGLVADRSASRPQLPPVVSAGLRQRSIKAQGVAVGVACQLVAQDDTMKPINSAAIIKAMYVLMAPHRPVADRHGSPPPRPSAPAGRVPAGAPRG